MLKTNEIKSVSRKIVAQVFKMDASNVNKWCSRGCPRNNEGTYDLSEVIVWRFDELALSNDGNTETPESKNSGASELGIVVPCAAPAGRRHKTKEDDMAGKAIEFTDANFEGSALLSDKPVLIDFWAVWCGPCKMVGPVVEAIAEEYDGRVVVGKLDVDSARDVAVRYNIQSIPTLLFLKNGQEVDRIIGSVGKGSITAKLEALL